MRRRFWIVALWCLLITPCYAGQKTYCGRIICANAFDGCKITDGHVNPIVMDRGGAPTKMPRGLAKAIEKMDFSCGCVAGTVKLDTDPMGGTYVRFTTASSAYKIEESKCIQEGLTE
jgi:hypothetical protein